MIDRLSIRQILTGLVWLLGVGGIAATFAFFLFVLSVRDSLTEAQEDLLRDERIAAQIVSAVRGQLLVAHRFIYEPHPETLERYRELGDEVYDNARRYISHDLEPRARSRVEAVLEKHQEFEVAAQSLFDHVVREGGDVELRRLDEIDRLSESLLGELEAFLALRRGAQQDMLAAGADSLATASLLMVAIAIALAVVIFTVVRILRNRLVRPLSRLTHTAERVGEGAFGTRTGYEHPDEIGAVARAFDAMAARIERTHAALESRNLELDRALSELRSAQEELVQREKLGALGSMLAGLAHEINNPLAAVLGYGDLLVQELGEEDDARYRELSDELARPLLTEAARARDIVRDLLHFARTGAEGHTEVPLRDSLDVVWTLSAAAFRQHEKRLRIEIPRDLRVAADPQRLQQVFLNLVVNGLDSIRENGGKEVRIAARPGKAGDVVVDVEDDGPGFADLERAFEPFFTTKPVGEGTGLGLSLVHRFVEEGGGSVRIDNLPDRGARVRVRLPRWTADDAALESVAAAERAAAGEAGGLSVLVVEDEQPLRKLAQRLLEREGYRVDAVADGESAIEKIRENRYDVVLSDIRMPGPVDGAGLFRWVRTHRPEMVPRFVFVTGLPPGEEGLDGQMVKIVRKPYDMDDLLSTVRSAGGVQPAHDAHDPAGVP